MTQIRWNYYFEQPPSLNMPFRSWKSLGNFNYYSKANIKQNFFVALSWFQCDQYSKYELRQCIEILYGNNYCWNEWHIDYEYLMYHKHQIQLTYPEKHICSFHSVISNLDNHATSPTFSLRVLRSSSNFYSLLTFVIFIWR